MTGAGEQTDDPSREDSMQTPMETMVVQTVRQVPRIVRAAVRLDNAIERRRITRMG